MADTFDLEIATPEKLVIHEQVTDAQIPAEGGMIGVLPEHAALISQLGIGELTYTVGGSKKTLVVSGGWVEVLKNHVRVLADSAETPNEIDLARAQASLKRAEERLANLSGEAADIPEELNAVKRAQARTAAASAR